LYVAGIPVRLWASAVTVVVDPLAGAYLRLRRLMVKAARVTPTRLPASLGRLSVTVARQLAGTVSWARTGGYLRVPRHRVERVRRGCE
jgi:hypothetical protein